MALAPAPEVQRGLAHGQPPQGHLGQPPRQLGIDVEPVVWGVRPQAEDRLQQVKDTPRGPGLGDVISRSSVSIGPSQGLRQTHHELRPLRAILRPDFPRLEQTIRAG